MTIRPIAHIHTEFPEKFGIPRQSGLADGLLGRIVFESGYRVADAVRGLEGFDYLWLIWEFSANRRHKGTDAAEGAGSQVSTDAAECAGSQVSTDAAECAGSQVSTDAAEGATQWQPVVRPPRLGGNRSMGVFATRSPFRPNPIGLSSVRIDHIDLDCPDAPAIWVRGADLMDGTPIYDIKPYITYADSHPDARSGYVDSLEERALQVVVPDSEASKMRPERLSALTEVLSLDPRPSYQDDPERIYGLSFDRFDVHFKVCGKVLTVTTIDRN